MPDKTIIFIIMLIINGCAVEYDHYKSEVTLLDTDQFRHYVDYFNRMEDENIIQAISNEESWDWMVHNIPLFECPQDNFEEIWYYRWWTLRKHIKGTPQGLVMTEFLVDRSYADKYNLISCALGHHIYEARWLYNPVYLDNYIHVWYRGNNNGPMEKLHKFSSWTADAVYNRFKVSMNYDYTLDILDDLVKDYYTWEEERLLPSGLFWQRDVQDGMEESISGGRHVQHARPTINSYMYGNAIALSKMAELSGKMEISEIFRHKADTLRQLILENLWNNDAEFFQSLDENGKHIPVKEAIGYIPWYFNLPWAEHEGAWRELSDPEGFLAPFGLTTAEQRHPEFRSHGCCNCEWDGAVWPFATSQTLTGLANMINQKNSQEYDSLYFRMLELYVESQYYRGRPYIGEYLDETTGYWLKGDQERSRYYNHSTFNDLVITGLVGLRPRADDTIEINPLIPENQWDWFCLDDVLYHNMILTIFWDRDGTKYNRGKGFYLLVNGKQAAHSETLEKMEYRVNP